MNKILYNTQTQLLQPWTAGDAPHVVALEPIYEELDLIQNERPDYNPGTHHLQPTEDINLETKTVTRGWTVVENPPIPAPEATPLQVRAFLIRRRMNLADIPALIAAKTAEGPEREEALMRWEKTLTFPKNYPLVVAVAAELNLSLDEVWDEILAIE